MGGGTEGEARRGSEESAIGGVETGRVLAIAATGMTFA